jgi:uncharacterized protein (TIGR03435 family)
VDVLRERALTEKLGLRLESKKGPVPVFVIEKIERPSENCECRHAGY